MSTTVASASAQWAVTAPVFVPMLMLVGWIALIYVWVFAPGMPVGPEAPTYYVPSSP